MDFIFPFPVLHIQRLGSGIYEWGVTCNSSLKDQNVGLSSIEECLQQVCQSLEGNAPALEVRYRGVSVGTFPVTVIRNAHNDIADLIVSRYAETMDYIF